MLRNWASSLARILRKTVIKIESQMTRISNCAKKWREKWSEHKEQSFMHRHCIKYKFIMFGVQKRKPVGLEPGNLGASERR